MCSLALAGVAASLAGTVMGGINQYQQSQAQAEAARRKADFQARAAENEAASQRDLARAEMQKGAAERDRVIWAGLVRQGELASGLGASGFALDSGSSRGLLGQGAEEIQQEASLAGQNAALKAWERRAGAARAENEAALAGFEAKTQRGNSKLGLASTVLGGLGRGLTGFYRYK